MPWVKSSQRDKDKSASTDVSPEGCPVAKTQAAPETQKRARASNDHNVSVRHLMANQAGTEALRLFSLSLFCFCFQMKGLVMLTGA